MKKDIKDYMPLYLGCDVTSTGGRYMGKLVSVGINDQAIVVSPDGDPRGFFSYLSWLKPHLRPLSDAQWDEKNVIGKIIDPDKEYEDDYNGYNYTHYQVGEWFINYLIKNDTDSDSTYRPMRFISAINKLREFGFDCDGLIENGLAIDKTKS